MIEPRKNYVIMVDDSSDVLEVNTEGHRYGNISFGAIGVGEHGMSRRLCYELGISHRLCRMTVSPDKTTNRGRRNGRLRVGSQLGRSIDEASNDRGEKGPG